MTKLNYDSFVSAVFSRWYSRDINLIVDNINEMNLTEQEQEELLDDFREYLEYYEYDNGKCDDYVYLFYSFMLDTLMQNSDIADILNKEGVSVYWNYSDTSYTGFDDGEKLVNRLNKKKGLIEDQKIKNAFEFFIKDVGY